MTIIIPFYASSHCTSPTMADRFSTTVKTALAAIEKKKDATPATPATLRLTFSNQADGAPPVVVDAASVGTHVTPVQAKEEPALALASGVAAADSNKNSKFLAVSLDPDAPFPSFPFLGPILHGVQPDLTVGAKEAAGDWHPLVSDTPPIVDYIKPGPPAPSAAHRYVFLLYKQPDGLDSSTIREKLGWAAEGLAMTRTGRMRFAIGDLETKLGLGAVVAINYFESSQ